MKKVIIIHYHLNPGGVTGIIESQVKALKEHDPGLNISIYTAGGSLAELLSKTGADIKIESYLDYLYEDKDFHYEYLLLNGFFTSLLKKGSILHMHNPNLGKNPILTYKLYQLSEEGFPLVYHLHDFIEDRPSNYTYTKKVLLSFTKENLKKILYPGGLHTEYVVLTNYDRKRLLDYGIDGHRISVVPNPVEPAMEILPSRNLAKQHVAEKLNIDAAKKLITYPVRVIQRKNIGEYILFCHLFSSQANWLVTMPPKNPAEYGMYAEWKKFCAGREIPLIFDAGSKVDYKILMQASDFCFTTSIREGFGMAFTEPWMFGVPVIGRRLNNIIPDLEKSGMVFPLLYNSVMVNYNGISTDFASMDISGQMNYIDSLLSNSSLKGELLKSNPVINDLFNSVDDSIVDNNKKVILTEFSLKKYAERLNTIYQKITC